MRTNLRPVAVFRDVALVVRVNVLSVVRRALLGFVISKIGDLDAGLVLALALLARLPTLQVLVNLVVLADACLAFDPYLALLIDCCVDLTCTIRSILDRFFIFKV